MLLVGSKLLSRVHAKLLSYCCCCN